MHDLGEIDDRLLDFAVWWLGEMMDVLMADDDGVEIKRDVSNYGDEHLFDNCVELMRWFLSVVTASTERRFFRSCNNIMKYENLKINITLSTITICIKPFSNQNIHVNAMRDNSCSKWSPSLASEFDSSTYRQPSKA